MVKFILVSFALLMIAKPVIASEILLRLSGKVDFPGILSLQGDGHRIDHLCFLGEDAKGNVDLLFLTQMSEVGMPEGQYRISEALPQEQWPEPIFSRNGALRFVAKSAEARKLLQAHSKLGLVVHGRDFFPLAERMTANPKMIRFFSDQLFEQLSMRWGALRISNWDMDRLHDFYKRHVTQPAEWQVKVVAGDPAKIKKTCEPLKVKRKVGD
jgi:hypothetical protein